MVLLLRVPEWRIDDNRPAAVFSMTEEDRARAAMSAEAANNNQLLLHPPINEVPSLDADQASVATSGEKSK